MSVQARLEEIRQIMAQYRAEVGSKRRPWPESIKRRVFEVAAMGLKMKAIAEKTGIPYHTIISWRQEQMREGIFHAVAISETSSKVATVTVPTVACDPVGTVTVATPDGYRIEATNYQSVVHLIQSLRRGS